MTDVSLRYVAQFLPSLERLVLAACAGLTDAGLVQLGHASLPLHATLATLDLSGCAEVAPLVPCTALRCNHLAGSAVTAAAHQFLQSRGEGGVPLRLYSGHGVAIASL